MLLPDLDTLPKWVGHRSLGALLIDKELHDREAHATEHKILNDLQSGKRVSIQRVETLFSAIIGKWCQNDDLHRSRLHTTHRRLQKGEKHYIQVDFNREGAQLLWCYLAKYLPKTHAKTRKLLDELILISTELHRDYRGNGSQTVAPTLSRFGERPLAEVAQSQFLAEMTMLMKEGNEEVARVELSAFGALLLSAEYFHDSETSVEAFCDSLAKLFVAHQGRVNPLRSFSNWLERLEARTGYAKDQLLLDGFVHPVCKTETLLERDPRNLIRNARRYRNGDLVPTFHKTQDCLRSLRPELEEGQLDKWKAELDSREFGLIFVLLVANSARSIKKFGGVPERPCQAVYDLFAKGGGTCHPHG